MFLCVIDKSRRTLIWLDILGVKDSVVLSEMSVIVALTKGMCAINIWNKGIIVGKKKVVLYVLALVERV